MQRTLQTHRAIAVHTPLENDDLLLIGFTGREAISQLFKFELDLVAENHAAVPEQSKITYEEIDVGNRAEDRITEWERIQEVRSGQVTSWHHSFELPHNHFEATLKCTFPGVITVLDPMLTQYVFDV